jgi:hypothetical protein
MNAEKIMGAIAAVTKIWTKQRKAEERRQSASSRRHSALIRSSRTTLKEAAERFLKEGYLKASDNGRLPAMARQIMYACRGPIQEETGEHLDDKYFTQTLLPNYMIEHPDETADWNVEFDARGHFTEPHTQRIIPLGTADVQNYLDEIDDHEVKEFAFSLGKMLFPTMGPERRYSAILFIEKEGFMALFEAVRLAERFDIAIMSTKGMSVTAARFLVDRLNIPLLVLHDFDKSGFSILGTLQRDTRRYEFQNEIEVIDLGLRLTDVQKWELESEAVSYGKSNPRYNLVENGATEEEINFLCSEQSWPYYSGQRVELNAFTSADLVTWIESKLEEHGIKKVVPDLETLGKTYRRNLQRKLINEQLHEIVKKTGRQADEAKVPKNLERNVKHALQNDPAKPWDVAVADLAELHDL